MGQTVTGHDAVMVVPGPERKGRQPMLFAVAPTPADETADDARYYRAQREYAARASSSVVPSQCRGCGEWNAPDRPTCRYCNIDNAAA